MVDYSNRLSEGGTVAQVGGFQLILLGLAAALLLRLAIRPLAIVGGSLLTALVMFGGAVLMFAGKERLTHSYERVSPFIDPGGYFVELVAGPTEEIISQYKSELAELTDSSGRCPRLMSFHAFNAFECQTKKSLVEMVERQIPIRELNLCNEFRGYADFRERCNDKRTAYNSHLLWGSFVFVLGLLSSLMLFRLRQGTLRDLAILLWAGGAQVTMTPRFGALPAITPGVDWGYMAGVKQKKRRSKSS